ncbi:MAG: hypothetical protein P4L92_13790 [Rudaea sp.]|nr:hypothetical protein [Rudaea sp.]
MKVPILLERPSAFIPVAMSVMALILVVGSIAVHGIARQADEGTVAHLWQLLIAGQLPVAAFFAIKWLPRTPGPALRILVMQLGAALAAIPPVFILGL